MYEPHTDAGRTDGHDRQTGRTHAHDSAGEGPATRGLQHVVRRCTWSGCTRVPAARAPRLRAQRAGRVGASRPHSPVIPACNGRDGGGRDGGDRVSSRVTGKDAMVTAGRERAGRDAGGGAAYLQAPSARDRRGESSTKDRASRCSWARTALASAAQRNACLLYAVVRPRWSPCCTLRSLSLRALSSRVMSRPSCL